MRNKVIVIGCGRLGASISNLSSERGENVVVIDKDAASFDRLNDLFSGYRITADGTDPSVLEEAYIKTAKEVVIATGNDNVNLFLAHLCSQIYAVPSIYVRFDDPEMDQLVKGIASVKAIYPFELSLSDYEGLKEGGSGK
jgi:trk system potassium uptake protein